MAASAVRHTTRTVASRGAVAVVSAIVVNVVITWAVTASGAVQPFTPLQYPRVAFLTAAGAVGATVVYGLLLRWSDRPRRAFAIVAAVVLVLSWVPDVTFVPSFPGSTTAGIAVLMLLHTTTAVVCYVVLTR